MPNGTIIKRVITGRALGNFCFLSVVYKGVKFGIGDGDEYMRGYPDVYRLKYPMPKIYNGIKYIVYPDDSQLASYAKSNPDGYCIDFDGLFKK